MSDKIPDLESRFLTPEGWQWGTFERAGRKLRYGWAAPEKPKAVIVCLPGLSDFIEKFFETAHWALAQGYAFYMMDWVGQGKSSRLLENPHKRHSDGFQNDIDDFHAFVSKHGKADGLPLVMLAHSMGGNIGMHYLAQHPGLFSCAAFSAPMFGVQSFRPFPDFIIRTMGSAAREAYVPGGGDWRESMHLPAAVSFLTRDPVRNPVHNAWMIADPELQVGGVTFGWVYEANESCKALREINLKALKTPCLIALAEHEVLVDNEVALEMVGRLANAEWLELAGSYHEPLMERDAIRNKYLNKLHRFIEQSLKDAL